MNLIATLRGCPESVIKLGSDVHVTSTTTFATIRRAIACKLSVAAAAVAVFADNVEVTNYADEIGGGFATNGLIDFELRTSTIRATAQRRGYADVAVVAAKFSVRPQMHAVTGFN
jgi:hypothetical protein